jgi:hypothetical protein
VPAPRHDIGVATSISSEAKSTIGRGHSISHQAQCMVDRPCPDLREHDVLDHVEPLGGQVRGQRALELPHHLLPQHLEHTRRRLRTDRHPSFKPCLWTQECVGAGRQAEHKVVFATDRTWNSLQASLTPSAWARSAEAAMRDRTAPMLKSTLARSNVRSDSLNFLVGLLKDRAEGAGQGHVTTRIWDCDSCVHEDSRRGRSI